MFKLFSIALFAVGLSSTASALTLVDYSHTEGGQLRFVFDQGLSAADAFAADGVVIDLTSGTRFPHTLETDLRTDTVVVPPNEEGQAVEYSLVMRLETKTGETHSIEIVRQTPDWLKARFNFDKPDGYSILGRRTVSVGETIGPETLTGSPMHFGQAPTIQLPKLSTLDTPLSLTPYPELVEAARLTRLLWQTPLRNGPIDEPYATFLSRPFDEKLSHLRTGDFAIMCSGMRDLFLHATLGVKGLTARAVEAYNYDPQLPDLIRYGHSATEVWVDTLQKWILIDPWLGIALEAENQFLSARDLKDIDPASVSVIALLPIIERYALDGNGQRVAHSFRPQDILMTQYDPSGADGHLPGYLTYFQHLVYRPVALPDS